MFLSTDQIRRLSLPFDLDLYAHQTHQISTWTALLIKWNAKINLTTITKPEEIIVRHFAESMYLSKAQELRGRLLDVGSGAGFPGLALRITNPELQVVLLEPVAKKRAFLKEVIRECGFESVEVRGERIEEYCRSHSGEFGLVTARALGSFDSTLPAMVRCLRVDGELCLWLTRSEAENLSAQTPAFNRLVKWCEPISVPLSRDREIWHGKPVG
ncbi:MAG TPA: 16S rRNA (guanine(527)-N(7))-methyltransferase RsmG [Terriglobia bacterium]|nr:16S rRNA (guanine(527)-N(7))-methyltransferase RsmG [Terriglobia bacterium]